MGSSATAADRKAAGPLMGSSATAADRKVIGPLMGSSATAADRNAVGPSEAMLSAMARSSRSLPAVPRSMIGGARSGIESLSVPPMSRTSFTQLRPLRF